MHDSNESRCVNGTLALASGCVEAWPSSPTAEAAVAIEMETGGRLSGADGLYPHFLLTVLPILDSGWVVLGELQKFCSFSAYRFQQVAADGDVLRLTLAGEPGERVQITVLCCALGSGSSLEDAAVRVLDVTIGASGTTTVVETR